MYILNSLFFIKLPALKLRLNVYFYFYLIRQFNPSVSSKLLFYISNFNLNFRCKLLKMDPDKKNDFLVDEWENSLLYIFSYYFFAASPLTGSATEAGGQSWSPAGVRPQILHLWPFHQEACSDNTGQYHRRPVGGVHKCLLSRVLCLPHVRVHPRIRTAIRKGATLHINTEDNTHPDIYRHLFICKKNYM